MKEEKVVKIINEIFERHGHIYDGLAWYDDRKANSNTPMPKSLQNYFRTTGHAKHSMEKIKN